MKEYCPYNYGFVCPNKVCKNCNEPDYENGEDN